MFDFEKLKKATAVFGKRHNCVAPGNKPPEWSKRYEWEGGFPNDDEKGVYAFFCKDRLIYIGIGAAKVGGNYAGHGLGNRLIKYVWWDKSKAWTSSKDRHFKMRKGQFENVDEIRTCPINAKCWYLAFALEQYLIKEMQPEMNIQGK